MRLQYRNKKATLWLMLAIVVLTMFLFKFTEFAPTCFFKNDITSADGSMMVREEKYVMDEEQKTYSYGREMPLIFIGGVPRSGTTLMRAMLDAHPDVRCGQETRVIPRILQLRSHWMKSEKESMRLLEAGITKEVMNGAIAQFCLEIIAKHGEPAPRLCNKDPLTLKMGSYVIELFPNAKFLFMVRDGRATVHSIISRHVTITGFDLTSYRQCMRKWNFAIEVMHNQCKEIGKERCMMVYYEQLVLHPEEWMRKILKFLDVPWNDAVLHHEEFINKPNGVPLSKVERSSDQVIKPVNLEALSKWVGNIPENVVRDMADIAPMLSVLGYDPYANPPDYGKPDAWVQDNTFKVKANQQLWENKARNELHLVQHQIPKEPHNTQEADDKNINNNNNNSNNPKRRYVSTSNNNNNKNNNDINRHDNANNQAVMDYEDDNTYTNTNTNNNNNNNVKNNPSQQDEQEETRGDDDKLVWVKPLTKDESISRQHLEAKGDTAGAHNTNTDTDTDTDTDADTDTDKRDQQRT